MKIFWSWQSDTPGKTGRHFVRDALLAAVEMLKQPPDVEEPAERASRAGLHVDQDRAGVPGSPDLAATILEKIGRAAVFMADVTPVAATADGAKKVMNSNVAIELGYALRALTDRALIMVMNEHYGAREDLPFDLRHKAGPLLFRLPPDADKQTITAEKKRLAGELVHALKPYLSAPALQASPAFPETPHKVNAAVYFELGEHLAKVGEPDEDEVQFSYSSTNGLYLRVTPTRRLAQPLPRAQLLRLVTQSSYLQPLHENFRESFRQLNEYGAIICEPAANRRHLKASTQIFLNGELWGFNAHLLTQRRKSGQMLIPSQSIEQTFASGLADYLKFAAEQLKINPPYTVEAGLTGLQGAYIAMPNQSDWGPIHESDVSHRAVLNDNSLESCSEFLLRFFEKIYDLTGHARPNKLYGFPPD